MSSEAKYREYLEITGSKANNEQLLEFLFRQMEDLFSRLPNGDTMILRLRELMTVEALTDRTVKITAPYYDDEALDAALVFYRSPEGQRFLASGKASIQANQEASVAYGSELADRVIKEFLAEEMD